MNSKIRMLTTIALSAGALLWSAGCELIASVDRGKIPDGTGASGGTGGAPCTDPATQCPTPARSAPR